MEPHAAHASTGTSSIGPCRARRALDDGGDVLDLELGALEVGGGGEHLPARTPSRRGRPGTDARPAPRPAHRPAGGAVDHLARDRFAHRQLVHRTIPLGVAERYQWRRRFYRGRRNAARLAPRTCGSGARQWKIEQRVRAIRRRSLGGSTSRPLAGSCSRLCCCSSPTSRATDTGWSRSSRDSGFGGVDRPSVYRTLAQLERDGLVVSWADDAKSPAQSRRLYRLTPEGERALRVWMGVIKEERDRLDAVLRRYAASGGFDAALAGVEGGWGDRLRPSAFGRLADDRADATGHAPSVLRHA